MGINVQMTTLKVILEDAVRRSSDRALHEAWPGVVQLRGLEKGMRVLSRVSFDPHYSPGIITRVRTNGNYDIEKRVDELSEERRREVKRTDKFNVIKVIEDGNVPQEFIQEQAGSRWAALGCSGEPEWELKVARCCRMFDTEGVAKLLSAEIPAIMTFGHNRTFSY